MEKLSQHNREKYLYNDQEVDFEIIEEFIKVKNKPNHIEKVRKTNHGPLIGNVTVHKSLNISLCSKALQPNQMINGLFKLTVYTINLIKARNNI